MRPIHLLVFAVASLWLVAAASAQTGRVTGTVKDADGKAIKGAVIRATNDAVNASMTSTTDDKGRFTMIGLRTGQWALMVEAPGYLPLRGPATVTTGNSAVRPSRCNATRVPCRALAVDRRRRQRRRGAAQGRRYDDALSAISYPGEERPLTSVNRCMIIVKRRAGTDATAGRLLGAPSSLQRC
jgi:hypothetical protein